MTTQPRDDQPQGWRNPLDTSLTKRIRVGVWASIVSATMLVGIAIFWVVDPAAPAGAFAIVPDSDAAHRFAGLTAIFKAVGDVLPPAFILLALGYRQFRLAGLFHVLTLILVIAVDMVTWASFVPDASLQHVLMHVPFAIPIAVAAFCFLTPANPGS